eukprot:UN3799
MGCARPHCWRALNLQSPAAALRMQALGRGGGGEREGEGKRAVTGTVEATREAATLSAVARRPAAALPPDPETAWMLRPWALAQQSLAASPCPRGRPPSSRASDCTGCRRQAQWFGPHLRPNCPR